MNSFSRALLTIPRSFRSFILLYLMLSLRADAQQQQAFFEKHCYDCHDADGKKGGLDLTSLKPQFSDKGTLEMWVNVHDKMVSGEMPPKQKERPPAADVKAVAGYPGSQLHTASLERQKVEGRVASRRMNRTEYENTLRELFGVPVLVKELLPEDGTVGGFDTVASALTVSPAHLVAYQRAADAALDAVIASGTKREFRESFTGREWFEREVKGNRKHVPRGAAAEGEMAVLSHQTQQHWELNVMPREAAKTPGLYRIRLTAAARNTGGKPLPVRFGWEWMMASTDLQHIIAYRDVPACKPTTLEVLVHVSGRLSEHRIGVCGYTLPGLPDEKEPAADWSHALGLEIHRFEIEGPLGEWPSAGHKMLFGGLPLEPRSFAEARAAGNPLPQEIVLQFDRPIKLAFFTLSSSDDSEKRDPVDWEISGSDDGVNFTSIFTWTTAGADALWTARNQVLRFDLPTPAPGYTYLRYLATRTGNNPNGSPSNEHALGEIEFFEAAAPSATLEVIDFAAGANAASFSIRWSSTPGRSYRLVASTTLAAWPTVIEASLPGAPGESSTLHSFTNPFPSAPAVFFRVEQNP